MRFVNTARTIAGSSYYRYRPIATLQLLYSKWKFARRRTSDPRRLLQIAGLDPNAALQGFEKWAPALERIVTDARQCEKQGNVNMPEGQFLFGVTRALRPAFVIETGVASGVSTCFLLAALIENTVGTLFSVDLPTNGERRLGCDDAAQYSWPEKGVGWAIPSSMKSQIGARHVLILDDVRSALPRILEEVPYVDFFFHDDLHLPEHMLWEYESVWPRLRAGGVLASHDANMGWIKFCRRNKLHSMQFTNINTLCAARKP